MRVHAPRREQNHATETARRLVATFGGRFSKELGIDLDAGGAGVDAWFCLATLFGTRIGAGTAVRTYRALADAGVCTVLDAGSRRWDDLVDVLDSGGYARYDFRTATRLQELSAEVNCRFGGSVSSLATVTDPRALERMLDALPGWGPTTVRIFLRELPRCVARRTAVIGRTCAPCRPSPRDRDTPAPNRPDRRPARRRTRRATRRTRPRSRARTTHVGTPRHAHMSWRRRVPEAHASRTDKSLSRGVAEKAEGEEGSNEEATYMGVPPDRLWSWCRSVIIYSCRQQATRRSRRASSRSRSA